MGNLFVWYSNVLSRQSRHPHICRLMNTMIDQIMTVKEVATYLKVNDRTIYRMAMSGKIPAFRVGASWRFKSLEIDAWIESERNSMQQPSLKKG